MAIGTPYLLGTNTNVGGGVSTISITTSLAVPAGGLIAVCADSDLRPNTTAVSSISDSAGNSYARVAGQILGTNIDAEIWAAQNVTALAAASTITVNWFGGTADVTVTAVACTGLATAGAPDQAVVAPETPAGTISLQTGQLGTAPELAIAYWVSRNAQGSPAITSDWNSFAAFDGTNGVGHHVNTAWQIETTADPVTATATTPSAGTGWAGILVTFRTQVVPTAIMKAGGALAGFPVIPVAGTATLNTGGSILGPEELAPWPPPVSPAFPAGYGPSQADFTTWVQRSFGYIADKIVFRAEQTTGQSLGAGSWVPLQLGSVLEDPFGGWSASVTTSQAAYSWLAPYTGWYRVIVRPSVTAGATWLTAAAGVSGVNPVVTGAAVLTPSGVTGGTSASLILPLIGGQDYVQFLAQSSAGSTTDTTAAGRRPSVEIVAVQADLLAS